MNPENNPPAGNYLKRLKCKRKSETPNEERFNKIIALQPPIEPAVEFIKQVPLHPRERYKRKAKQLIEKYDRNQLKFKGRESSYSKYPKTVCDEEILREVSEFSLRIKVSERDKTKRREEIFDKIIKQIQENDKHYISHDPTSDSFYIKADKQVIVIPDDEEKNNNKTSNITNYQTFWQQSIE